MRFNPEIYNLREEWIANRQKQLAVDNSPEYRQLQSDLESCKSGSRFQSIQTQLNGILRRYRSQAVSEAPDGLS